ncbi:MAG: hypothetical protein ABI473_00465 [Candidatus Dormibacter sp.]
MEAVMRSPHDSFDTDRGHLLTGEAGADECDPKVIQRWIAVYAGLVAYKERLQPVSSLWATAASPDAAKEMTRILQHRLLGDQLTQYRRRLLHWQHAAAGA